MARGGFVCVIGTRQFFLKNFLSTHLHHFHLRCQHYKRKKLIFTQSKVKFISLQMMSAEKESIEKNLKIKFKKIIKL
jgi:hypothetical protein